MISFERILKPATELIQECRNLLRRNLHSSFSFVGHQVAGQASMVDQYSKMNEEKFIGSLSRELELVRECTGRSEVNVLDIGANIGVYSIGYSAAGARFVFSFEPFPETFAFLKENVSAKAGRGIEVFNFGFFSRDKKMLIGSPAAFTNYPVIARLTKPSDKFQSGCKSIYTNDKSGKEALFVMGDSCQVVLDLDFIDLIKIDVEGAELEVLRGLSNTVAKYRPVVKVELNKTALGTAGTSVSEIVSFLLQLGIKRYRFCDESLWSAGWEPLSESFDAPNSMDVLFSY